MTNKSELMEFRMRNCIGCKKRGDNILTGGYFCRGNDKEIMECMEANDVF